MVAALCEVLLDDDAVLMLDEMPLTESACFVGEQDSEREQKAERGEEFAVPASPNHHDAKIECPQPAVRRTKPTSRPPHAALPLSGGPDEERGNEAAHESDLLGHLDEPVDTSAEAGAIFAGAEEEGVDEEAVPDAEDEDEEGVETSAT